MQLQKELLYLSCHNRHPGERSDRKEDSWRLGARGRGTKEKRVADRLCHLCKITNSHVFLSFEVFSKGLLELLDSARKNDHALRTPRSRQG